MSKKIICLFIISSFFISGCTSWHSLRFETESQPIQFGPHLQKTKLDTLGIISGISTHNYEEETYSEAEHVSIVFEGTDEVNENINTTVYRALYDDLDHFIADGQIIVEVEHGISWGAIFLSMLASKITDEESDVGSYDIESIYYNGIVYKIKSKKSADEQ